jgi:hypothetical protein
VDAHVVDALKPVGQPAVEFVEGGRTVSRATLERLEVLLNGAEEPLDLALAPGVVGLGVEKADIEVGTDQAGVVVDEGAALIGVELAGQAAAAESLLEGGMKTPGGGIGMVECSDDEA